MVTHKYERGSIIQGGLTSNSIRGSVRVLEHFKQRLFDGNDIWCTLCVQSKRKHTKTFKDINENASVRQYQTLRANCQNNWYFMLMGIRGMCALK